MPSIAASSKALLAIVFLVACFEYWLFFVMLKSNPSLLGPSTVDAPALGGLQNKKMPSTQFLSYQQSFGFFDDIPDDQWQRAQEIHSKIFPNYFGNLFHHSSGTDNKAPDFMQKVTKAHMWNGNNFHVEFHCPLAQRLPATAKADGPKWVCDPHRLKNIPDCLVYSFGSNGKSEFEKGVKDEIGPHCEIHTFDPVSRNKRNGDFATALKGYATFHNYGLGTEEQAKENKKLKTLTTIMEELGHINRTVHIFKIDCEWCEWFTYPQWLEHDLRQILVETHNAPMPEAMDFFFELHNAGFAIFSKEANYENQAGGIEFAFVKLAKDFFQGKFYSTQGKNGHREQMMAISHLKR